MAGIALRTRTVVLDTVYTPDQTRLLRDALACGCRVIPGSEMFISQAAAQFALWHQRAAPLGVLRTALAAAGRGGRRRG